jgi:hypothetical protein
MDASSYAGLVTLLVDFRLAAIYDRILDDDDDRYQRKQIQALTKPG